MPAALPAGLPGTWTFPPPGVPKPSELIEPRWLAYPPSVMGTACCPWVMPAISQILVSPFARSDRAPASLPGMSVSLWASLDLQVTTLRIRDILGCCPPVDVSFGLLSLPFQIRVSGESVVARCKKPFAPHPNAIFSHLRSRIAQLLHTAQFPAPLPPLPAPPMHSASSA